MATEPRNPKLMWFVIWAGLTLAPVAYYFVGSTMTPEPVEPAQLAHFRSLARVFPIVQLLLGAFLFTRVRRTSQGSPGLSTLLGGEDLAAPADFQTRFIIASALVEACAIWGFVLRCMGAPIGEYIPFGAAALAVMLVVGLPNGLSYWRAREIADRGGSGAIG